MGVTLQSTVMTLSPGRLRRISRSVSGAPRVLARPRAATNTSVSGSSRSTLSPSICLALTSSSSSAAGFMASRRSSASSSRTPVARLSKTDFAFSMVSAGPRVATVPDTRSVLASWCTIPTQQDSDQPCGSLPASPEFHARAPICQPIRTLAVAGEATSGPLPGERVGRWRSMHQIGACWERSGAASGLGGALPARVRRRRA